MVSVEKYDFSFTASSLRLNDLRLVARHILEGSTIDYTNELGNGKSATGKRMLAEFNKRLSLLTMKEMKILLDGDLTSQKQIAFLSVCKVHAFIRDFTVEVLREKLLIFDYKISDGEYLSFFRRKCDLHPELEALTEVTKSKVKQVTFKILEQSGLIDDIKSKNIQPQILDGKVIKTIAADDKQWLKLFFMSDMDIENIRE